MSKRFSVHYRVFAADAAEARRRAEGIALEQTVEIPRDVVPAGFIEDEILGRIEDLQPEAPGRFVARISYSTQSTGSDLAQVLNVVFGNSSIQKGIKVIGLDPGPLTDLFPGPRFGIAGIRRLAATPSGPMIAPVLKPQGSTPEELAAIARACVLGGAQIIKEDHGLADQPAAPFRDRVLAIGRAVAEANAQTGRSALYFPSLAGPVEKVQDMAHFAAENGAQGLLVMPGLFGFDLSRWLSSDAGPGLPVMAHPSFLGAWVLSEDTGFSHGMMFGTLQRLSGADISVFPNVGGRFGFSADECRAIADACHDPAGFGAPILPSPGGGMSPERASEMLAMYGEDTVFLLGGSLLRARERIGAVIGQMLDTLAR